MKLISILVTCLVMTSFADGRTFQIKTSNANTETQILAATGDIDHQKRTFDVSIDLKNIGTKAIRGIRWQYAVQENWNGDGFGTTVTGTTSFPELLRPNMHRNISLTNNKRVRRSELKEWLRRVDNENASVRLTGVIFEDGSQWLASP